MTRQIGILRCDTVLPQYKDRFGNFASMFRTLIEAQYASHGAIAVRVYNVEKGHYPSHLDECDAYIITGSRASVYDALEWIQVLRNFIIQLHEDRKPTAGICFGHQMIADALGGKTLRSDNGWGVGVHTAKVQHKPEWMQPQLDSFNLIVSHQDQVHELPHNAKLIAGSDFCPHASFMIDDHMITFQGHPEFTKHYSQTMLNYRRDKFGENVYLNAQDSYDLPTHEHEVMQWILTFLFRQLPSPDPVQSD